jgi:cysteine/glycine-rich protein
MSNQCPRCEKVVYHAEQVVGAITLTPLKQVTGPNASFYHKACFRCIECKKSLDSTNCTEKGNAIYCKTCHSKNFGPKGYGFGGGSGVLSSTGVAKNAAVGEEANYVATSDSAPAPSNAGFRSEVKGSSEASFKFAALGGGNDVCPVCKKTVYFAERVIAVFHCP